MGNYGRSKVHPRAEEFVENLWGQLAFMANSLIFILIGVLFVKVPSLDASMILVIVVTILWSLLLELFQSTQLLASLIPSATKLIKCLELGNTYCLGDHFGAP